MRPSKKTVLLISGVLAIGLLIGSVAMIAITPRQGDTFNLTGTISVYVGGKLVERQTDLIQSVAYDWIICKAFNASLACGYVSSYYANTGDVTNACELRDHSGTLHYNLAYPYFTSASLCSLTAIGLTFSSTAPTPGTLSCTGAYSSYGLAPIVSTITHTALTNTITLTATFTNTDTAPHAVGGVCLMPYNDAAKAVVDATHDNAGGSTGVYDSLLADALTTAQLVNPTQSITIAWTINF